MTPIDRAQLFDGIRRRFGRLDQGQVEGVETLLAALEAVPGIPLTQAAYLLATAWHETAHTLQPVRETRARNDAQAIARLESAWASGRLPQVRTPYWRRDADGRAWYGRGYVQLTHRHNYEHASDLLGVDLVANPDLALDPALAARLLVRGARAGLFTGRRLGDYLTDRQTDYVGARRVINGQDRAREIAAEARLFERALKEAVA